MKKKIIQWGLMTVLGLWGMVSFMVLAGEEAPEVCMTLGDFFLIKALAITSFSGCILCGKWLKKGSFTGNKHAGGLNMEITLEQLNEKIDNLSRLTLISSKTVLDFEETILFTGLSKGHLYRLTSNRQIPYFKKNRKLYFKKSELEEWMLERRIPTEEEIQSQATTYLATHKI